MARLPGRFGLTRFEADEYYQLALDAYKKRSFDVAINNLNDAIALTPNRAELYATRGFIYLEDGVKDKAEADFLQALKLYPLEMLAHYGRGMMAYSDQNWDEAIAHFTDAYKGDPNRAESLYYLALSYHRKGDNPEAARRLMEMAVGAFPEGDKRKSDAQRWLRELDKLAKKEPPPLTAPANNQPKLLP